MIDFAILDPDLDIDIWNVIGMRFCIVNKLYKAIGHLASKHFKANTLVYFNAFVYLIEKNDLTGFKELLKYSFPKASTIEQIVAREELIEFKIALLETSKNVND